MRNLFIACAASAIGLLSLPAAAADNGIYIGAGVGQSSVEFDGDVAGTDFNFDASTTAYKVIAGWRFIDWLAVEANYVDLGSSDDRVFGETLETDIDGFSASVVGFLPVGPVDIFARVGAVDWSADISAPALDVRGEEDGTDLTYGIGAQFRVWSLGIRAEYEIFDIEDADTVDMLSLGVTWTFL
jgi:OOP family OmpA-OmpF porin